MNINRRLEAMRERLERSRPCTMTFTMKNGEIIKANLAAAGIMTVLCHPAPNREISDYE